MSPNSWLLFTLTLAFSLPIQSGGADSADSWKSHLTNTPPGDFPLLSPCLLTFKVSWNGVVKAGQADVVVDYEDESEKKLIVTAQARSTGAARVLWAYDATQTTWIDTGRLAPIKLHQVEDDRRETNSYETEFIGDFAFNKWVTTPKIEGKEIEDRNQRVFEQAGMRDLVSAALYLRSQPLNKPGQEFSIVTFPFRDPYLVKLTFGGREKRKFSGKKVDALKFDLKLAKVRKDGSLESQDDKLQSATIWLTDDELRLPLELRSEIFVGSVRAALVDHTPSDETPQNSAKKLQKPQKAENSLSQQVRERARGVLSRLRGGNPK